MEIASLPTITVCPHCQGDSRLSASCHTCHGAGAGLSSPDGYLVWGALVDDFSFGFRRLRLKLTSSFHVALALAIFGCIGFFIFHVLRAGNGLFNFTELNQMLFAQSAGAWFWLGLFLACFFIFRLRVYTEVVSPLPSWGKSKKDLDQLNTQGGQKMARDVSKHFSPAAWALIENAYELSKRVGRIEVEPAHLFAAALTSPAGGIFITRLGFEFEKIKDGLVTLLRRAPAGSPTTLSLAAKQVLLASYLEARRNHRKYVGVMEIFLQTLLADQGLQQLLDMAGYPLKHVMSVVEWLKLHEQMKEEHDRFILLASLKPQTSMNRSMTAQQTVLLDRFGEDLTRAAALGYLAPMIGRETEMENLLRAMESGRHSVILVGEPGSGKETLLEALARRMVEEDVPPEFFDKRLVSVHLPELISSGDPAMAPERLLSLLHEVGQSGNIVLALAGIEILTGDPAAGAVGLADTLSQELDKGYCLVIATTTPQAWTNQLERRSLGHALVRVNVPDLDVESAVRVLMGRSAVIEYQQGVFFSYAALEKAAELAARYIREEHLPESALHIIEESAILARKERGEHTFVSAEDVARVIHEKTNIPVESVTKDESEKLLNLETRLHARVIGQEDAVTAVSAALRRARAGMHEAKRPIANFLFLGPTGVGKTELTKALAAEYFGSEKAMIRLDMSEYQDHSSIARIIGVPGDERGGWLTEAIRQTPFSIVLLDELEKAHPDILTLFLQVMDDGRLTDGMGRTVDCTNIILIATSNAGSDFIQTQILAGAPMEQIKTGLLERELKGIFRPEFLNRFDGVIVFKPLTLDDVTQIAWLLINSIAKRLEEQGMIFRAEDAAVEALAKAGFDPIFGARPLRRVMQERVDNGLADLVLRKAVARRDTVILQADGSLRVEKAQV
ncbi:ATP-dependent Clp protease ATP-binding subunit [Candidatus Uhrbacteria bacterium]|nr:ATP-dependent Clp protease ATP-binding subunit [Candidatus Uhrbacteria bacterium]